MGFEKGTLENNFFAANVINKAFSFPWSLTLASNVPDSFQEISDEGDVVSDQILSQSFLSFHIANHFTLFNKIVYFGAGTKLLYEKVATESAFAAGFDAGLIVSFNINVLRFLKVKEAENFFIGASVLNLGSPVILAGETHSLANKMRFDIDYVVYATRRQKIDVMSGFAYYLPNANVVDNLIPGFAIQYSVLNTVFLRGGLTTRNNSLAFSTGIGIKYKYNNIYHIQTDYNLQPDSTLGISHQVNLSFSYNFESF